LGAFEAGVILLPQALVMAVFMPLAGRLYDRFGPKWPAIVGLSICAVGTYLLHDLNVDTSHHEISLILMLRACGMGLAMMPIMTAGLAAVPPALVPSGSAFNNVIQRTAASLGLAILAAVLTTSTSQFMADRSALVDSDTDLPTLGPGAIGHFYGMYGAYRQTANQVFVLAIDNLMIIVTVVTLVGLALAIFLRSGAIPHAEGGHAAPMD
jgi:MFS family permease